MKHTRALLATFLVLFTLLAVGCGGNTSTKTNPTTAQGLIDPSGNWGMTFTDSNGNFFILSALYFQTGAVVTGINFSEVGNVAPGFQCIAQRDISISNGLVANVNQFSGDLAGNFGTVHFSSTLNDAGTHTSGTYTITPPQSGNCLGVALTGTFTGDEFPSMGGNAWTGTISCTMNCPTSTPVGTVNTFTMTLSQDDATGSVTGTYSVTGIAGLSSGTIVPDINDFLSGSNIQEKLLDNNGTNFFFTGGPFLTSFFNVAGLRLDRTYQGILSIGGSTEPVYQINMSH
jgi:hypothetical protein